MELPGKMHFKHKVSMTRRGSTEYELNGLPPSHLNLIKFESSLRNSHIAKTNGRICMELEINVFIKWGGDNIFCFILSRSRFFFEKYFKNKNKVISKLDNSSNKAKSSF